MTALFGRSGAGKTSVVNMVAGLIRPDRGRIVIDDTVLSDRATGVFLPPHRRRLGYVFQDARLFPHLTVQQNLTYGRRFAPAAVTPPDRVVEMLDIGPLLARRPGGLSGGERQRVALGRALLSEPRMLLMDEPLSGLDEARKADILPYIERLRDEFRLPVLYVSHAMSEVARLATTLVLLDAGRVIASGPVALILSDPALAPGLGLREAGAILTARVAAHDDDGLTRLDAAGGSLWLPRVPGAPGTTLRLRILAQDVMLATTRPEGVSALNILAASVQEVRMGDGPGALVQLQAGPEVILARITRRSAVALDLRPGRAVFAVLKAIAVAPQNIGGPDGGPPHTGQ